MTSVDCKIITECEIKKTDLAVKIQYGGGSWYRGRMTLKDRLTFGLLIWYQITVTAAVV